MAWYPSFHVERSSFTNEIEKAGMKTVDFILPSTISFEDSIWKDSCACVDERRNRTKKIVERWKRESNMKDRSRAEIGWGLGLPKSAYTLSEIWLF